MVLQTVQEVDSIAARFVKYEFALPGRYLLAERVLKCAQHSLQLCGCPQKVKHVYMSKAGKLLVPTASTYSMRKDRD